MDPIQIVYCDAVIPHHEYITHVGTSLFRFSKAQAIHLLDSGYVLYTVDAKRKVALLRPYNVGHKRHIRTYADGVPTNNLLHLPPCPPWLRNAA